MTNPELNESNGYVRTLSDNPLTTLPKTGEISIRTTTDATLVGILTAGRKITGENSIATAIITGVGGTITSVDKLTEEQIMKPTLHWYFCNCRKWKWSTIKY